MKGLIEEGEAKINAYRADIVSKDLPVFYNPVMKLNRDLTVLLLNSIGKKNLQIADPLAGSGIRGARFMLELDKGVIKSLAMNDLSPNACKDIADNLTLNGIEIKKSKIPITITNKDANLFMLESTGFDYIDIDPFGPPTPFLDSSIARLSRGGILAVTATDTAALAGSSPTACIRKYWGKPMRNEIMHEVGMRILARRVQLIGAEHEKALTPIFCYTDQHYYRIFFSCEKGREKADAILKLHKHLVYDKKTFETIVSDHVFNQKDENKIWAGPLWTGQLWDSSLVENMLKKCEPNNKKAYDLLSIIAQESKIQAVGFYDLHRIAQGGRKEIPRIETLLKKGLISRTHFLGWGVRTTLKPKEFFK